MQKQAAVFKNCSLKMQLHGLLVAHIQNSVRMQQKYPPFSCKFESPSGLQQAHPTERLALVCLASWIIDQLISACQAPSLTVQGAK